MAHKFGAQFLLPQILAALGVAVLQVARATTVTDLDDRLTRAWQSLPSALRTALACPAGWPAHGSTRVAFLSRSAAVRHYPDAAAATCSHG